MSTGENEFSAVCFDRKQAHEACLRAYSHAQALLEMNENALVICKPAAEPIGVRQRRFLHGVVLRQISEQARVDGVRYTADIWKEHFRRLFLPEKFVMERLPGQKKAHPVRKRQSTEQLGVRGYSDFTEQVIEHAVSELGVQFHIEPEERALLRRTKATAHDEPEEKDDSL